MPTPAEIDAVLALVHELSDRVPGQLEQSQRLLGQGIWSGKGFEQFQDQLLSSQHTLHRALQQAETLVTDLRRTAATPAVHQ
ncbi:MAG: hypothetical protein QOJ50_2549 [Cryptosporangiaceae bacterium]|nr:hypothetical protein [Cryptosporangiaceae bacterium]